MNIVEGTTEQNLDGDLGTPGLSAGGRLQLSGDLQTLRSRGNAMLAV